MNMFLVDVEVVNDENGAIRHPPRCDTKGYCTKCIDNVKGDGYNTKKAKLPKIRTQ